MKRRRRTLIGSMIAIFLVVDIALAAYTVFNTTAEVPAVSQGIPPSIRSVQISSFGTVAYETSGGVYLPTSGGLRLLMGSIGPAVARIGDRSDAVAVLTENNTILYYPPGLTEPAFSKTLAGQVRLVGITEIFGREHGIPVGVQVILTNSTGSYVMSLATTDGRVASTLKLGGNVTAFASSPDVSYTAIACDNGSVVVVFRTNQAFFNSVKLGGVEELVVKGAGDQFFALSNTSEKKVLKYYIEEKTPRLNFTVPAGAHDLRLKEPTGQIIVRVGDALYGVEGAGVVQIIEVPGAQAFAFSQVGGRTFVAMDREILAFIQGMQVPLWRASTPYATTNILTDYAGGSIYAWSPEELYFVDNSLPVMGAHSMWLLLGLTVVAEGVVLFAVGYGGQLRSMGRKAGYVVIAGAFVGILAVALFQSAGVADWFGGELNYAIMAAALGGIAALITWNSQSGLFGLVLGTVGTAMLAIPIGWLAGFILWSNGFSFPPGDQFVLSAANGVAVGIVSGLGGSIAGYIAGRYIKQE